MTIKESAEYQRDLRMLSTPEAEQMWQGEGSWKEHVLARVASGYCAGNNCRSDDYPHEKTDGSPLCVFCSPQYEYGTPTNPREYEVHHQWTVPVVKTLFTRPWELRHGYLVLCGRCGWQQGAMPWTAGKAKAAHLRGTCLPV
jgi:hypothetical protein